MQRETACRLVHYHHIMRSMDQGRVLLPRCVSVCCVCPPVRFPPPRVSVGPSSGQVYPAGFSPLAGSSAGRAGRVS